MSDSTNHNGATPAQRGTPAGHRLGLAGRTAKAFIESPITPLLLIAFFLIGFLGALVTPREEDPQISVPMVDILVAYPGASSNEVANLVSEPLERLMSELSGVKHVYSMSHDGFSMVTVRFKVGEQMEPSLVKLYDKLQSNMDVTPKGVMPPLVKPKSIDDVPVVTVTLSSDQLDLVQLRKLGLDVQQKFKALENTGLSFVTGGSFEHIRVELDPSRLSSYNLTPSMIAGAIQAANQRTPAGDVIDGSRYFEIYTGDFLKTAGDVGNLIVSARDNMPVYLRDVANIVQGPSETKTIVESTIRGEDGGFSTRPAVTVAVAKKFGSNGVDVAHALLHELDLMKGALIPDSVDVIVSRDYGETARDKVSHLIMKLFIVSALVTVLAYVTMGFRPALIVLITIPAVLLMSLAVAYILGFTINRVSMFALVFAIGILVDDAIVVVENIYRRWLADEDTSDDVTTDAVDEVGNPTILATFTVVAALLPMGFVSEMMGPYMLPIPVLSSAAMLFSLVAAFIFVPWLAARVKPSMETMRRAAAAEHRQSKIIAGWYTRLIVPIMNNRLMGWLTLFGIVFAMMAAVALLPLGKVAFKMLPYDNKSELQVVIDMPEGSDLFLTANLATRIGAELQKIHEVTAYQTYVGTSSPFNFNGLVRHYFMRNRPWQGDLAVQLLPKHERERSSHVVAEEIRATLTPIAEAVGARLTIAEAPPGPPVLAPLVAEIYGPTAEIRREVASHIMEIMHKVPDIEDVNSFLEAPHNRLEFQVDRQRAAMFGVSVETINRELMMVAGGFEAGALQSKHNLEQAVIVLQAPLAVRVNLGNLSVLPIPSDSGQMVPLGELGRFAQMPVNPPIYHKDLRALEYVTGDVTGPLGAPLYGMLSVDSALQKYVTPDGQVIGGKYFSRPENTDISGFKWDGEWQVTYVTFRDMGLAFMAALVLIYILVVAEFRNFLLPAVVMAPIPLTLIGIVPGHWMLGADFTATSMIGFIALAGIIVRNSILLVEFARAEVEKGMDVKEAITLAAQVRLRPIVITALALIIGSMVLLSDPIFQGMAVSLLFGSLVATFLTLVVIPMGCISARNHFEAIHGPDGGPHGGPQGGPAPDTPPSGGNGGGGAPAPSGRPAKLERKTDDAAAPAASGRPPRLEKKSDSGEDAAAPGRPARMERKSDSAVDAPTAAPGRPAKLERKSEAAPAAEAPAPSGRPPRLERKPETAAAEAEPPATGRPPRLERKPAAADTGDAVVEAPVPEATPEPEPEVQQPDPAPQPAAQPKPKAKPKARKAATKSRAKPAPAADPDQTDPNDPLAAVIAAARRAATDGSDGEGDDA